MELTGEEDSDRLSKMLEPDIIESIPELKLKKAKQDKWKKYRKKGENGPSTPPEKGPEG